MNNNQRSVINWLLNTNEDFIINLIELEESYDSVPSQVSDSFESLTYAEKLDVIKKVVDILLVRTNE